MTLRIQVQSGGRTPARRGDVAIVRRATRTTLEQLGVTDAELSITLLRDRAMARLNREHLEHDGTTDVLSFALFDGGEAPVGDIYIGVEQAARQAEALAVPLREELARLAIHGTLHVLGHDHPAGRNRERSRMWRVQERILATVMAT